MKRYPGKQYLKNLQTEFKGYNLGSFKKDLLAGITVTAVALPLALAFGIGSGATAQAGLITAIIAGFVIGFLSGGSFQISGPTGAMAVILVPLVTKFGLNGIFVAGLISGIILIIAGIFNLGKIVSIIPAPVIAGFTSGIALLIVIGQIDNFFGTASLIGETTLEKFQHLFTHAFSPNWWAVGTALATVAVLLLYPKKWNKYVPSSLVALILVTAVVAIAKIPVAAIGEIPRSLFPDDRINFASIDWNLLQSVAVPAISIALLGMIESLLCGEVGGRMKNEKLNTKQELISQGIGNIIIPFVGGVPATAAIARTSVAIKSGGKTRLVSIIHSVGLLISVLLLAPVMSIIPLSVLAGILIVVAFRMNEWHMIKFIFSKKFFSAISKFLLTMLATVAFDLTVAILIGVIFSCLLFILQISRNTEVKVANIDEEKLTQGGKFILKKPLGYIKVAYLSGPIFFTTISQLNTKLSNLKDTDVLILSMRGVPIIDTSGIMELYNLWKKLKSNECKLIFSGLQKPVQKRLEKSGIINEIGGEGMIFWGAEQAITYAQELNIVHTPPPPEPQKPVKERKPKKQKKQSKQETCNSTDLPVK